ncbi:MAG: hypothetical protein M5U34_05710 [Chloroflexi bacterium]|nr:hypothetical protein [Chloroflexota bacterium]
MTFKTRDQYRKVIEQYGRQGDRSESEIAQTAVFLAQTHVSLRGKRG